MAHKQLQTCVTDDDCRDNPIETHCFLGPPVLNPDGNSNPVQLMDCSDLTIDQIKARQAMWLAGEGGEEGGGSPCDTNPDDNVCLAPGWSLNPNGTLHSGGTTYNNYYEVNPGQQYHIQPSNPDIYSHPEREAEIRGLSDEEVLKRITCNLYNYNQSIANCPIASIPMGQEITSRDCNNPGNDCNLVFFDNYCNDEDTRNRLADEWHEMPWGEVQNNRQDMIDRLSQIRSNCNTCGPANFLDVINKCPKVDIPYDSDIPRDFNCGMDCPDLQTFNNICNNTDTRREALVTQMIEGNFIPSSDAQNLSTRIREINDKCRSNA